MPARHLIRILDSRVANAEISAAVKQDWRDSGRMRISSRAAARMYWPTPYSLTASAANNAAARRVPAPSRPAHRDAAKTIPLRGISAGSFLQVSRPSGSWRGAQSSGLNTVVDVSIGSNFLRIDNRKSIAEKASFLKAENLRHSQ